MKTPALCKTPVDPDTIEFAAIGGDKPTTPVVPLILPSGKRNFPTPNHDKKAEKKFEKLNKQWNKAMEEGMKEAGIKIKIR